jgi:hypothetical protein
MTLDSEVQKLGHTLKLYCSRLDSSMSIHLEPNLVELLIAMVMQFILLGNMDFWHGTNMNSGIDQFLFHQWLLTQQLASWLGY